VQTLREGILRLPSDLTPFLMKPEALDELPPDYLPSHLFSVELCNTFLTFFNAETENINQALLVSDIVSSSCFSDTRPFNYLLYTVQLPTVDVITSVSWKSKSTTCQLDPLLTQLVKVCLSVILPFIVDIIHSSLISETVLYTFKAAFNFITSILTFISKILEKVVLHDHLSVNNLYEQFHSCHSTETALVKIL